MMAFKLIHIKSLHLHTDLQGKLGQTGGVGYTITATTNQYTNEM